MSNQTSSPSRNREARFYVGTYTNPAQTGGMRSLGIYTGGIDLETGRLKAIRAAGKAENPSFLALAPDGKALYAALERANGAVAAFRVESDDSLTLLNELPTGAAGTCHVSVDATGGAVFAANYRGATFAAFRTASNGLLESLASSIPLSGSGPHPQRQTQSFAHSIYPAPGGPFVYGCDLGSDHIWSMKWESGTLSLSDPPSGVVQPGAGPRHLAFGQGWHLLYVCNELDSTITVFQVDGKTGAIAAIQTVPLLPEGMNANGFLAAEIAVHPSGHSLYASTRDTTNAGRDLVTVFSITQRGTLSCLQHMAAKVQQPRSFAIDPTGQWMIVAGQTDHRIVVLKIDPATGELSATDQIAEIPAPVCVLFKPEMPSL